MNDTNELTEKQLNELLLITRESINESLLNIKENSNLFELCFPDVKTPLHYIDDNMYDNEACYVNNEVNETSELTEKQLNELLLITRESINESLLNIKENSNLFELYFPAVKTPLHYINDNMYDNEACYGNNEVNEMSELTDKQLDTLFITAQKYTNNQGLNLKENSNLSKLVGYDTIETGKKEKPTLCIECNIQEKAKGRTKCYQCIYRGRKLKPQKKEKPTLCIECNINKRGSNRAKCYQCIYRIRVEKNPKKEKTTLCIECNINEKKKNRRRCHECIYRIRVEKNPKKETTLCI